MAIRIKIKIDIDALIEDEAAVLAQARRFFGSMSGRSGPDPERAAAIDHMVVDPVSMVQNLLQPDLLLEGLDGVTFVGSYTEAVNADEISDGAGSADEYGLTAPGSPRLESVTSRSDPISTHRFYLANDDDDILTEMPDEGEGPGLQEFTRG